MKLQKLPNIILAGLLAVGVPASFAFAGGFKSGATRIGSSQMPDPYTPVDGTMNVTGSVSASVALVSTDMAATGGVETNRVRIPAGETILRFNDASGNQIATLSDAGTTGNFAATGTITATGDITANGLTLPGGNKSVASSAGALNLSGTTTVNILANGTTRFTATTGTGTGVSPAATFGFKLGTTGAKVACDSTNAGSLFYENTASDATVAKLYLCGEKADDTFAWGEVTVVFP